MTAPLPTADWAALAFGTLSEQSPGPVDPRAQANARDRLRALADLLAPDDRALLAILARGEDGCEMTNSELGRRLGISRQAAARRRRRLYRRIRRVVLHPPPDLPTFDRIASHLNQCVGVSSLAARRLAAVANGQSCAAIARRQQVSRSAVAHTVKLARAALDPTCPTCQRIASALSRRDLAHGGGAKRGAT